MKYEMIGKFRALNLNEPEHETDLDSSQLQDFVEGSYGLYFTPDGFNAPTIGFIFISGEYRGWGLGATRRDTYSELYRLQKSTEQFIGKPGKELLPILKSLTE
jgi:hypothetical protein